MFCLFVYIDGDWCTIKRLAINTSGRGVAGKGGKEGEREGGRERG